MNLPPSACRHCNAELQDQPAFCGSCGNAIARRSYRGPRRLGIAGLLLAILGGVIAVAAFSTVQVKGVPALAADLLSPTVNQALTTAGADQIELAASGSGASFGLVIAFIAGTMALGLGLALLMMAGAWTLVRLKPLRHRRDVAERSRSAAAATARAGHAHAQRTAPKLENAARQGGATARDTVAPRVGQAARRGGRAGASVLRRGRDAVRRARP